MANTEDNMDLGIEARYEALLESRKKHDDGGWPIIQRDLVLVWLSAIESQNWNLAQRIAGTVLDWSKTFRLVGAKPQVSQVLNLLQQAGQDLIAYHLDQGSPLRELLEESGGAFTGQP